jgi:hypothetical protein
MKKFIPIILLSALLGCQKTEEISQLPSRDESQPVLMGRANAFPISIYMGIDTSYFRVDSCKLVNASAYLPTCGTAPETESAWMGVSVWQISGSSDAQIVGNYPNITFRNLTFGSYTFVGRAYVIGFRTCDSTYMNENAYDTLNITVLKNRKKR